MGITGLLSFLERASKPVHIAEFRGCVAGIDTYCWLHKGAFGCAEKLVREEDTDAYVWYCMKYIKLLKSYNIRPVLVFDGQHLPAKSSTEGKRRDQRQLAKKKAAEFLRNGKPDEARNSMRQAIDVTHKMALRLIKECRRHGIDCIVAPYEADAQLAYLDLKEMVDFIITEDSDLVLFGCKKTLFKMDAQGFGTLVDSEMLHICMKLRPDVYTFDKFRYMCILSGCDYLESLPGIGLKKALKFVTMTADPDIYNVLSKLPSYLNLSNLVVTNDYKDAFMMAEATFKHQLVFDSTQRKLLPLTDPELTGTRVEYCMNAGKVIDQDLAFQLALGNLDPFTFEVLDNWLPGSGNLILLNTSIWSPSYENQSGFQNKMVKPYAPDTKASGAVVSLTKEEEIDYDSKWQEELQRYKVRQQATTAEERPTKKQKIEEDNFYQVPSVPFKKLSKFQRTLTDYSGTTSCYFSMENNSINCDTLLSSIDQYTNEKKEETAKDDSDDLAEHASAEEEMRPAISNGAVIQNTYKTATTNKTEVDRSNTLTSQKTFSSDSDGYESIVCEPDVMSDITPMSQSESSTDFSDTLLQYNSGQHTESLGIDQTDNSASGHDDEFSLSEWENDMNQENKMEDSFVDFEVKEKPEELAVAACKQLAVLPLKKKMPAKNQLTILEMFANMKKSQ